MKKIEKKLRDFSKELMSQTPMIKGVGEEWARGYIGGQFDAGYNLNEFLNEIFGAEDET